MRKLRQRRAGRRLLIARHACPLHLYRDARGGGFLQHRPQSHPPIVRRRAETGLKRAAGRSSLARSSPRERKRTHRAKPKNPPEQQYDESSRAAAMTYCCSGGSSGSGRGSASSHEGSLSQEGSGRRLFSSALSGRETPDFRGMTLRSVLEESSAAGLAVEVQGSGVARDQQPPAGFASPAVCAHSRPIWTLISHH